ncbi:hypothetical protein LOTGIDRAFT_174459 [Lottia gigantea]|uniref:Ig-like domain-containing protein n=1 Tax=Lottia gigantea TaxID=225164 RepID=V4ALM6_LOTGI|nr:hypothetical protein LOTGIDRAFT_174459 [Lottia gigantea]ESO98022.1 hypothetical protein LOTGIDRAFT_174459 [Lottia gigantea]
MSHTDSDISSGSQIVTDVIIHNTEDEENKDDVVKTVEDRNRIASVLTTKVRKINDILDKEEIAVVRKKYKAWMQAYEDFLLTQEAYRRSMVSIKEDDRSVKTNATKRSRRSESSISSSLAKTKLKKAGVNAKVELLKKKQALEQAKFQLKIQEEQYEIEEELAIADAEEEVLKNLEIENNIDDNNHNNTHTFQGNKDENTCPPQGNDKDQNTYLPQGNSDYNTYLSPYNKHRAEIPERSRTRREYIDRYIDVQSSSDFDDIVIITNQTKLKHNDPVFIRWFKDGDVELPTTNSNIYFISSTSCLDTGNYSCLATNPVYTNQKTKSLELLVHSVFLTGSGFTNDYNSGYNSGIGAGIGIGLALALVVMVIMSIYIYRYWTGKRQKSDQTYDSFNTRTRAEAQALGSVAKAGVNISDAVKKSDELKELQLIRELRNKRLERQALEKQGKGFKIIG